MQKLRFVLNTRNAESAGAFVCIKALGRQLLERGYKVNFNDWNNYDKYDVVIFMSADVEYEKARYQNKNIKIGMADPKPSHTKTARKVDFLLVSSIEQREIYIKFNHNIFIYYMFPDFESKKITHTDKDKITIAYHGNKQHLEECQFRLTNVINELGKKHDIKLKAIYNIKNLGLWEKGRPDRKVCPVEDVQWYPNCYMDHLSDVDIGIVPQLSPPPKSSTFQKYYKLYFSRKTSIDLNHELFFKSSANPGRIFVFGEFGIPVVSDATPSTSILFGNDESGLQVLSTDGWKSALTKLIRSYTLRERIGSSLYQKIKTYYSQESTFERFIIFLNKEITKVSH